MKRRTFLGTCALPLFAQNKKQNAAANPYPEQQHPESKRGRGIADFARSLNIRRGVPYVSRLEVELTLDVYSPRARSSLGLPGVLVFGLATFKKNSTEFRLDLDNLSIDPEPVAVFGASASGNLSSLLALTSDGRLDDPSRLPGISAKVKAACPFRYLRFRVVPERAWQRQPFRRRDSALSGQDGPPLPRSQSLSLRPSRRACVSSDARIAGRTRALLADASLR